MTVVLYETEGYKCEEGILSSVHFFLQRELIKKLVYHNIKHLVKDPEMHWKSALDQNSFMCFIKSKGLELTLA